MCVCVGGGRLAISDNVKIPQNIFQMREIGNFGRKINKIARNWQKKPSKMKEKSQVFAENQQNLMK
jgi:hypothetical protein